MMTADDFWANVTKTPTCWLWEGARSTNRKGERTYGQLVWRGKMRKAHRVAWELTYGPLPEDTSTGARGTLVLHSCDNPPCVRPAHLRTGTQLDNIGEAATKRRMRTGCYRGFQTKATKLTPETVLAIRAELAAGGQTQTAIAQRYGVCKQTITLIKQDRVW